MVTWKQWKKSRQAWWCTPVTPALGKLAEENCWSGVLSVKRQTTRAPNLSKAAGRIFRTAGGKDIHLFLTSPPGSANNVPVRSHTEAIRASQQDRDFLLVGLDHLCRALLRNVPLSRNAPPSRILGLFICTGLAYLSRTFFFGSLFSSKADMANSGSSVRFSLTTKMEVAHWSLFLAASSPLSSSHQISPQFLSGNCSSSYQSTLPSSYKSPPHTQSTPPSSYESTPQFPSVNPQFLSLNPLVPIGPCLVPTATPTSQYSQFPPATSPSSH
ncbi:uncharacterized protein [Alexandromys fortis]|uniref:uncharacterized protein isoform X2 n=1 Tax=Alexandromys fortis TaxID=100897 RepID=UPI0021534015|nr:uncharacterized protein LOC126512518 isoform X2 [Microtus fortis]